MSDRFNTIFGWTLFSGIIALGLTSISSRYFHTEAPENPGYVIEAPEEGVVEEGPDMVTLLNEAKPEMGQAIFAKCQSCHTVDQGGADGLGPNIFGAIGKPIGSLSSSFEYSSALSDKGGEWTYDTMDAWLKSPRAFASGTKMSFAGLSSAEDRANIIVYLREMGGGPPLPAMAEAPAEGEEVATEEEAPAEEAAE